MLIVLILAGLGLLYLYCLLPRLPRRGLGPLADRLYAHRGLWNGEIPENSLAAFRRAVRHGYGIALDVRASADGVPVVFHDDSLERMCGLRRNVSACTLRELQSTRLLETDETIPSLAEVLREIDGQVPLIVEVRRCPNLKLLCRETDALLRRYPGIYCVESFDARAMRWFRKNRPQVIRGQLAYSPWHGRDIPFTGEALLLSSLAVNLLSRPDFIAHEIRSDRHPAFALLRRMKVHTAAWTVRDQETMDRLREKYELLLFDSFIPAPENGKFPNDSKSS